MSKEIKLGAFTLIILAVSIWGFVFLQGKNLLTQSFTFKTILSDVTQLTKSSPVNINGYKVGSILSIKINPDNLEEMIVVFEIEDDFKIPKDAIIELMSDGIVAGKALRIKMKKQCTGADCAVDGDVFQGKVLGLIGSMVTTSEIKEYTSAIVGELKTAFEGVGTADGKGAMNKTIQDLQATMANLVEMTASVDRLVRLSTKGLANTMNNMDVITSNLAANNQQITSMLTNFNSVSRQLKDANLGNTIAKSTEAVNETKNVMTQLKTTILKTEEVMTDLNSVIKKASDGDGTLAKLMNDKSLYTNLEMTSKNMSLLLQDLRLNPGRYVKVSVFGKKNNDKYVKPEDDPAFKK
ncbi:MAG: MlaD family protein [Saprospiraceae bacterium]